MLSFLLVLVSVTLLFCWLSFWMSSSKKKFQMFEDCTKLLLLLSERYRKVYRKLGELLTESPPEANDEIQLAKAERIENLVHDCFLDLSTVLETMRQLANQYESLSVHDYKFLNDKLENIQKSLSNVEQEIENYFQQYPKKARPENN